MNSADAESYDFIIVGAGASGSVIANRLSEVSTWKILLLEAGDLETPYTQIPGMAGAVLGSKYDWRYITKPQETWCLAMVDRRCTTSTGIGLGGGTVINGMVYSRGNAQDYDLWEEQGNAGWSYTSVLPYFKKAENCAFDDCDINYHGQRGPLYVEKTEYVPPLLETFLAAGRELGYKIVDYNAKEQVGFARSQTTTKHGKRHSAWQSYLLPIKNRRNLVIKSLSHVTQILIDSHKKTATGVKYIHNDVMYIAKTTKEVIISAGPFNSPQLLMLSGVGPHEDLTKLHIPVINNLAVGRHLKDHAAFQGLNFVLNITKFEQPNLRAQIAMWLKYGRGPLATGTGLAFMQMNTQTSKNVYPDVELLLGTASFSNNLRIKEKYRYLLEPVTNYETFRIDIVNLHPKSTGSVVLNSKNPFDMPIINQRQYSDAGGHDIDTVLAAIEKVLELTKTDAFQKLGAHVYSEPIKECERFGFDTKNYWTCAIRYFSIGVRHQTGTCKMGPKTDQYAVVDNKLKVYGIHKLRVADSSVIPVSISGHTHASANMVGEKAADLIKETWF